MEANKNQLATVSQNSQIQSKKQKQLSDFIQNKEQGEIVIAIQSSLAIKDLPDLSQVLYAVSIWRLNIGLPKDGGSSEELAYAAQFIHKHFGFLTLGELELACNLFVTGKLDADIKFYGSFSPLFIGQVLNAYLYHRKITLADVIRKKEKYEEEEMRLANKPTPEQQANNTKETIKEFYDDFKETGELRDILSICYNFFRKHREVFNFNPSREEIKTATIWAEQKIKEDRNKSGGFLRVKVEDEDLQLKRYGRIWCVQNYFENVNIDVILNNIKPNLFS